MAALKSTEAPSESAAARDAAFLMITGYRRTQCLAAAVGLGLFDRLHARPASAADLANDTGAQSRPMRRLLRTLVAMGALTEDEGGAFRTTEIGAMFTSAQLGPAVRLLASRPQWLAWSRLEDSVRTGERAFDLEHGMRDWDFYAKHPEVGAIFDEGMRAFTSSSAAGILDAHDFGAYGTVADIGGGNGTLITAILTAHRMVRGILFDRPAVIERARTRLAEANVDERCRTVAGDFLEEIPTGADAYVMKWILHDWEDEDARRILSNCRRAMDAGGHLVVVERVIAERVSASDLEPTMADMQMMVLNGGVERTASEFRELLDECGFELASVKPTGTPVSVLSAVAV